MADFNRRFAVAPRNPEDAHRAVLRDAAELDLIFCEHHRRKLTKNLTIRFECREYQVTGRGKGYRLRGAEVTVCKAFDGSATVLREGRELPVRLLAEGEGADSGGGRQDRARARRCGEGGAAGAAGLQAAAGPSLAATVQARRRRARRPEDKRERRPPLWICGRVLRTGARPSGRVDSPWTTRSAESPSTGRSAARCPPAAHTRAPLAHNPTARQQVFSSRKRERPEPQKGDISTLEKRGHFNFALTRYAIRLSDLPRQR